MNDLETSTLNETGSASSRQRASRRNLPRTVILSAAKEVSGTELLRSGQETSHSGGEATSSSSRIRDTAKALHPNIALVIVGPARHGRTWHHQANPPTAIGRYQDPGTAAARNTGSGWVRSSLSPTADLHHALARQRPGNNPTSSCFPRRGRIRAIATDRCAQPAGGARSAAGRRTVSAAGQ